MLAALVTLGGNVSNPEPVVYIAKVKTRVTRHEDRAKP